MKFNIGDIVCFFEGDKYDTRYWWEVISWEEYYNYKCLPIPDVNLFCNAYLPVKRVGASSPFFAEGEITCGIMSRATLVKKAIKKEISYDI